jgi:hypothetical protein
MERASMSSAAMAQAEIAELFALIRSSGAVTVLLKPPEVV